MCDKNCIGVPRSRTIPPMPETNIYTFQKELVEDLEFQIGLEKGFVLLTPQRAEKLITLLKYGKVQPERVHNKDEINKIFDTVLNSMEPNAELDYEIAVALMECLVIASTDKEDEKKLRLEELKQLVDARKAGNKS